MHIDWDTKRYEHMGSAGKYSASKTHDPERIYDIQFTSNAPLYTDKLTDILNH
jgi:hypothetical protein